MIAPLLSWKTALAFMALAIVCGTVIYSNFLARSIAREERQKVEQWVEAGKLLIAAPGGSGDRLAGLIISQNTSIPIIVTDEKREILDYVNIPGGDGKNRTEWLQRKLREFASRNAPIEWTNPSNPAERNLYFYGNTTLLQQVRYYPLVQLLLVAMFISLTLIVLTTDFRSSQNQIWAGLAKETAHQLGTPLSSMQGWLEMLREESRKGEEPAQQRPDKRSDSEDRLSAIIAEMEKDLARLRLVSDRFGKIGSTPRLEEHSLPARVREMVDYIRRRAPADIRFEVQAEPEGDIRARISPPLFDWVIENLLKNALDAMEGRGTIRISMREQEGKVLLDLTDSGKGIPKAHASRLFRPGFTTKKRGWGLGLTLSRRIIQQYHGGQLFLRNSEPGKGATFRIVLKK